MMALTFLFFFLVVHFWYSTKADGGGSATGARRMPVGKGELFMSSGGSLFCVSVCLLLFILCVCLCVGSPFFVVVSVFVFFVRERKEGKRRSHGRASSWLTGRLPLAADDGTGPSKPYRSR